MNREDVQSQRSIKGHEISAFNSTMIKAKISAFTFVMVKSERGIIIETSFNMSCTFSGINGWDATYVFHKRSSKAKYITCDIM